MARFRVVNLTIVFFCVAGRASCYKLAKNDEKCPAVKARSDFDLGAIKGTWNVIEYYASSEEVEIYRCIRSTFSVSPDLREISMVFKYSYVDDPDNEMLNGNITWNIPNLNQLGHWVHMETPYEDVYNTYVLDCTDTWAVLLHCAEKPSSPRYLSTILLSRNRTVPANVRGYVRDKLPKYGVQLEYAFPMVQDKCSPSVRPLYYGTAAAVPDRNLIAGSGKHPMLHTADRRQTAAESGSTSGEGDDIASASY